jgi:hypothetical protein
VEVEMNAAVWPPVQAKYSGGGALAISNASLTPPSPLSIRKYPVIVLTTLSCQVCDVKVVDGVLAWDPVY